MKMLVLLLFLSLTATTRADVDSLVRDLQSRDSDRRRVAADELGKLGADARPAAPALVKALKDQDVFVRRFAALSLGAIGPDAKGGLEALAIALRDPEKRVQEAAASSLGQMGAGAVRPLSDVAKDRNRDPEVRRTAIEALGKLGKSAKAAVPALIDVLGEGSMRRNQGDSAGKSVRLEAVVTLGKIGPDAQAAVKKLEELSAVRDRDRAFRQAVVQSLRKIKAGKK